MSLQLADMQKEPCQVETIPYSLKALSVSAPTGKKVHIYSDSVPLSDLPQQAEEEQDLCMIAHG